MIKRKTTVKNDEYRIRNNQKLIVFFSHRIGRNPSVTNGRADSINLSSRSLKLLYCIRATFESIVSLVPQIVESHHGVVVVERDRNLISTTPYLAQQPVCLLPVTLIILKLAVRRRRWNQNDEEETRNKLSVWSVNIEGSSFVNVIYSYWGLPATYCCWGDWAQTQTSFDLGHCMTFDLDVIYWWSMLLLAAVADTVPLSLAVPVQL